MNSPRLRSLQDSARQYEKSLAGLTAINDELRALPPSARLADILELNQMALRATTRMLETTRERLAHESANAAELVVASPARIGLTE